jgi:hypothetical protein
MREPGDTMSTRPLDSTDAGVVIRDQRALSSNEIRALTNAGLAGLAPVEAWAVTESNRRLAYATHGVFRFFGKFPPPIARQLLIGFSRTGDWVLDPMCGSGTTGVEALALERRAVLRDVSPLSMLLCRVKTTRVALEGAESAFLRVERRYRSVRPGPGVLPIGLRNPEHWFLPETVESLARLRTAIEPEEEARVRDLLLTAFVSTVRRVSRATTQQGRLFLDVDTARPDAWPTFSDRFRKYAIAVSTLPWASSTGALRIECVDAREVPECSPAFRLAIVHPPYFNNYRYSSINSLELAWLGVSHQVVRSAEIREAFKTGKPEKVTEYVEDLMAAMIAVEKQLKPRGTLALMIGDTVIRGRYVPVMRKLLESLRSSGSRLDLERIVLRIPRFTEASWVASQRRPGDQVGVTLNDFVLLFSRP